MKILIFGGSFDPVHAGHEKMFAAARKVVKPDLSLIIPSRIAPLKDNAMIATPHQRLEMAKIAFEKYRNTCVTKMEILRHDVGPSYTIDTLKQIKSKYPGAKLYLLVGYDRYLDFENWKDYKEVLKLIEKIVIGNRNNSDGKLNKFEKEMYLEMTEIPASSQEIRNKINPKWLSKDIRNYLLENFLYTNNYLLKYMSENRFEHSKRVAATAIMLAKIHAPKLVKKAAVAGMFHDICKEFRDREIIKIVGKRKRRYPTVHTMHGVAGSIFLKKELGIKDRQILDAVRDHVIPHSICPTLTKIIYCADKLEPKRKNKKDVSDRVKYLRRAKVDLDKTFLELLIETKKKHVE